jgi:photosystem II stability/assembly factor-like uncharacterized protein
MTAHVQLLVGTRKGAFTYEADESRERWDISRPLLPGANVFHFVADTRTRPPRYYAAVSAGHRGLVAVSSDGGATWERDSEGLAFDPESGLSLHEVWFIQPGTPRQPGVVFAGTAAAGLFRSEDWGKTWRGVDGLNRHPRRKDWRPSAGDTALHSIQIDPRDERLMYAAISTGASLLSEDGGESWRAFSDGAPPAIADVHALRLAPSNPRRVWAQTRLGVFRSDDAASTWRDVTAGLPSGFGFPLAVSGHDADTAYVVPLQGNDFRVCPGQLAVWRTRDAGASWQELTRGLPGPHDYQSVYREGLGTDGLDSEGVYVGTSNGEVYASTDGGDSWRRLPGTLPPVQSLTVTVIE